MSECVFLHCANHNLLIHVHDSRRDEQIAATKQVFEFFDKEYDFRVKKILQHRLKQTAKVKTGREAIGSKDIQVEGEPENNLAIGKRHHIDEMTLER